MSTVGVTAGKGALHLADIDPELEKLIVTIPAPPHFTPSSDLVTIRSLSSGLRAPIAVSLREAAIIRGIKISEQHVTVRDGAQIRVRIYAPKEISSGGHPVYVAFHGGGFALGDIEMYDLHCITWAEELGVVSVNVDYRLAPEFTFPYAIHDSWDVTKWVAANAATIGGNLRKGFIVGGVSAGGNTAAVMSQLARDEKLSPPVTAVHLSIPGVIAPSVGKEKYPERYLSREQNKHSIVLDAEDMDFFQNAYKPDPNSHLFSPLLSELGGLPSTYFQICGMDPLRDEALIYKEKLEKEGIQTKCDIYSGVPHAFWSVWPGLAQTQKYHKDSTAGLKWLIGTGLTK